MATRKKTGQTKQSSATSWETEQLRLTAFLPLAVSIDGMPTWDGVLNEPPEDSISKPKTRVRQERGKYERGTLVYEVTPGRVEWRYAANIGPDTVELGFPSVGNLSEAIEAFRRPTERWLELVPPVKRLAFGATLSMPTESKEASYRLLGELLPSVKLDPETSDFSYTINRKRSSTSGISNLLINRLSNWRAVRLSYAISSQDGREREELMEPIQACRLELDINTVHEYTEVLSRERLRALFHELVGLGIEIAEKGDVP